MKSLSLFLFFLVFASINSNAQDVSQEQINFVNQFMEDVVGKNEKGIFKSLDKKYRKEQLRFLKGNKTQLLNELLAGSDIRTDEFVSFQIKNIIRMEVAEILELNNGDFEYIFRVRAPDKDALCSLLLRSIKGKFGFIGAVG